MSVSTFYRLKPIFIKCAYEIDYNLCTHCFNFDNIRDAYYNQLVQSHVCTTAHCIYYEESMGDNCICNKCNECVLNTKLFTKDKHEFIRNILCTDDEYGNIECVNHKCNGYKCGAKILDAISNNALCPTNNVDPNTVITYSFIKKVPYEYGKDEH